jgi:Domain of unknown function (DUF4349)
MKRFSDDADLAAALRAARPTPHPDFAAELDERAAAGFPRHAPEGSAVKRLLARARALSPRRALVPAGATALVAVVVATAVVAVDDSRTGNLRVELDKHVALDNDGGAFNRNRGFRASTELENLSKRIWGPLSSSAALAGSPGIQYADERIVPFAGTLRQLATGVPNRDVERSAEMVLGAEPDQVDEAAAEVFDAVHAHRGIVLRSSIQNGSAPGAGAEFELLIPSGKLGDALAAFSRIGEVRARHEATADITAPTVTVGERLRDSRARIDGLLAQLAEATTESEREAVEAELRGERRRSAALRSRLATLHRRANLSRVSLRIESGAAAAPSGESSTWGIGDALGDAGRILGVAAAAAVVGLAVLGPIALIALLAWLAHRAWLRRGRERALG